jgi:hypothetical protein
MAGTSGLRLCGVFYAFLRPRYDRIISMIALVLPLALLLWSSGQRSPEEPFVEVGVWYAGPGVRPPEMPAGDLDAMRRDLAAIRRAGFNGITTWIAWADAEPREGGFALTGLERLVAAAVEADLKISVVVHDDPAPAWAASRPDAARHFVAYLAKRLSLRPGILRVVQHSAAFESPPAKITVMPGAAPTARLTMWSQVARGARAIGFAGADTPLSPDVFALGETGGVITRNQALFAPLSPRERGVTSISGGGGGPRVEVRLLESSEALMIVGLNYAPAPRKVTISFSPDIPEAIWQNLETGTAVSFVMGKTGPFLEYTFGPRDALVLMIRKRR